MNTMVVIKTDENENIYEQLIKRTPEPNTFCLIPIITGATGYIPASLEQSMAVLGILRRECKYLIPMIAISESIKIYKTFLSV